MLSECRHCDGQGRDCWVWTGNTEGEFYNHAHFQFVGVCPFCKGRGITDAGRKALEDGDG